VRTLIVNTAQAGGNAAALNELGISVTAGAGATEIDINSTNATSDITMSFVAGDAVFTDATNLSTPMAGLSIGATQETVTFTNRIVSEGDGYRISAGGQDYDYVARDGDTIYDVAAQLALRINNDSSANLSATLGAWSDPANDAVKLYIANTSGYDNAVATAIGLSDTGADITGGAQAARDGQTLGGGLEGLEAIDVTTATGPEAGLAVIERLIQSSISAAADFGSSQGRIQTQSEFVSKIMDGLTSGIGALVDADMEEASARLQALQVQQQLGIQALSIANQAPQNILALFR
jgi:flagellin